MVRCEVSVPDLVDGAGEMSRPDEETVWWSYNPRYDGVTRPLAGLFVEWHRYDGFSMMSVMDLMG